MKIEIVKVGQLECNCYILDMDGCVLLIDSGDEGEKIINRIGDRKVIGIVITHYHFDHIGALNEIVNKYKAKVFDRYNLEEGLCNIDRFSFEVIYTPGHKEDCISIYFKDHNCMFCGDFIFKDGIGRCDLPGGNISNMYESLNKMRKYDSDIKVYSGHGDSTVLGYEIENN